MLPPASSGTQDSQVKVWRQPTGWWRSWLRSCRLKLRVCGQLCVVQSQVGSPHWQLSHRRQRQSPGQKWRSPWSLAPLLTRPERAPDDRGPMLSGPQLQPCGSLLHHPLCPCSLKHRRRAFPNLLYVAMHCNIKRNHS